MQRGRDVLLFILLIFSLFALPARAQDDYPAGEVFTGYSYLRADLASQHDNTNGWETSLAANVHKNFALKADFSGHYGRIAGLTYSNHLFLFGPKVAARTDKFTLWSHALFGTSILRSLGRTSNNFALAVGGGLDVNVHEHIALRLIQADYVFDRVRRPGLSDNSNNVRLSFGLVFSIPD